MALPIGKSLALAAGLGLAAAAAFYAPWPKSVRAADAAVQATDTAKVPAPRVTVVAAAQRLVVETVTATGTLVPREEVLVGPEIEGLRIVEILADEGDKVEQGQVLVRLSRETLDAQIAQSDAALSRADAAIAQAKSQIAAAQANAKLTAADLGRAQQLIRRGVSTQAILDQKTSAARTATAQAQVAKDALRAAEADRKSLQAQRRELMIRVKRTEIRAPAAGLISKRSAKLGAVATAAGESLFRIIKDGKIELDAEVPEQRLLSLKPGQSAKVILANDAEIDGEVRLVSPQVDATSRLGHARIALKENSIARTGAFARAVVTIRRSTSVTVPASAVLYENNEARVQIVEGDVVRARRVELGLVSGEFAEIVNGVKEGESLVLRAGAFLRDGDAITPVMQKAEAQ
ncbi:MAG: efflux RND transporter periplasmic adaptor subunit [Beijerinckiaceae bacterium]